MKGPKGRLTRQLVKEFMKGLGMQTKHFVTRRVLLRLLTKPFVKEFMKELTQLIKEVMKGAQGILTGQGARRESRERHLVVLKDSRYSSNLTTRMEEAPRRKRKSQRQKP